METHKGTTPIRFVVGDATDPVGGGRKVIVHVCNDAGKWGKGFVLAVSRRWREPEAAYRAAFAKRPHPALGEVEFVPVSETIAIANLIGQRDIVRGADGTPPVRYEAIRAGMMKIASRALADGASVHMPRIGCGLAGGSWERIEPILIETLVERGVEVTVYDFTPPR